MHMLDILHHHRPHTRAHVLWSWATALLLCLLAALLGLFPHLLLFLSTTTYPRPPLSALESFLALHSAVWLAALAFALVLNVPDPSAPQDSIQPSLHQPLLGPLTVAANISAFLAWNTTSVGPLASLVFIGSLVIGLGGLWVILFADSSSVSKTTGADKHTSSFIFGNRSAASVIKKENKKLR